MEVTKATVAILAAACVTAGAAGGYIITRDPSLPPARRARRRLSVSRSPRQPSSIRKGWSPTM